MMPFYVTTKFVAPYAGRMLVVVCFVLFFSEQIKAQPAGTLLTPFSSAALGAPPPSWRVVGLLRKKISPMEVVLHDGTPQLRVLTDSSYGMLVHAVVPAVPGPAATLRWRWQLVETLARADLRRKDGDDTALKVCAMFDLPLDKLSFMERNLLRLARAASAEPLPAATLCYVWDTTLPTGTLLPNAFSERVRYLVLNGQEAVVGQWQSHQRYLAADFKLAFGHESATVPPLVAIAIGADADNTKSHSLGYVGDLTLQP